MKVLGITHRKIWCMQNVYKNSHYWNIKAVIYSKSLDTSQECSTLHQTTVELRNFLLPSSYNVRKNNVYLINAN